MGQQSSSFLMGSNAKWLVPLLGAVGGFLVCCVAMVCLYFGMVVALFGGNIPTDPQESTRQSEQIVQDNPWFVPVFYGMICLPCLTAIAAPVGGFFFVNSYQKRNAPPPMVINQ